MKMLYMFIAGVACQGMLTLTTCGGSSSSSSGGGGGSAPATARPCRV